MTKPWKKGDRIAGFTHGVNSAEQEDGCFAEYAVVKGDVQMKTPDSVSDEEASTLGVGVTRCTKSAAECNADAEVSQCVFQC